MTRAQLEHILRAAAAITDEDEFVVVGSQSILGQFPDAPRSLRVSVEADLYPLHAPERADLIDGTLGELSPFHDTFGYYADGVRPNTAVLPAGWQERLVPACTPDTRGATGWCLEVHDLVLSKYAAYREKDLAFGREVIRLRLVRLSVLARRLTTLPVSEELRGRIRVRVALDFRLAAEERREKRWG
jgi:hypothetical protein